jgi:aldose 1-epimerase
MKYFDPLCFGVSLLIIVNFSCQSKPENQESQLITEEINLMLKVEKVAQILDQEIFKYTLDNGHMQVEMSNYGGLISRISVPDKDGKLENIALTLDSIPEFLTKPNPFFGATAGRVKHIHSHLIMDLIHSMEDWKALIKKFGNRSLIQMTRLSG